MIQEVIIVEGRQDVQAVRRAVDADIIITRGFSLHPATLAEIEKAYKTRGIIILTDPDSAGERIRRTLSKRFPQAKHAFVPREDATANDDIGVEQAAPSAILAALQHVHYAECERRDEFGWEDLYQARLAGCASAAQRRALLGKRLGIGYTNAKQLLHRLNAYGITREEFDQAKEEASDAADC